MAGPDERNRVPGRKSRQHGEEIDRQHRHRQNQTGNRKDEPETEWELKKSGKMRVSVIYSLIYTGLRVSELVNLNREYLDVRERSGVLRARGKGNKERTVPVPKELRRKLMEYLGERTDDHPALFVSNRGQRISVRNVQDILSRLNDRCGFKKGTVHPQYTNEEANSFINFGLNLIIWIATILTKIPFSFNWLSPYSGQASESFLE
jgi:integrase